MKQHKTYTVPYKRKQQRKTNYKKRINLLKSGRDRIVIRKTNTHLLIQKISFDSKGDHVTLTVNSSELEKYGWSRALSFKNISACYLTGYLFGKKVMVSPAGSGNQEGILDLGLHIPKKGSRLYAALKGIIDAGFSIPCSNDVFPPEERIAGKHITAYVQKLQANRELLEKRFSKAVKGNIDLTTLAALVEKTKKSIDTTVK